ncbi:DinB family protein [Taibaiella koreensis]|uniref:DinB family protein n=1 Tax=Taibaiella koreensis TaxID=1268548 RepID=UPI0013C2BA49|nr:DinB family protein [Taibaiella koreensis]
MKITEAIAQHLLDVHYGENWTDVWIRSALEDVTLAEAEQRTSASPNTIAALLHHITFYNKVILARLQGVDPYIGGPNGFDVPTLDGQAGWEKLQSDNLASAQQLADAIRKVPEEALDQPVLKDKASSSYYRQLHGVIEHAHYHLGQIVLLKKMIRND